MRSASPLLLLLAFVLAFQHGCTLHCLTHEHCGDNAVCVTSLNDINPKCMCLLGYKGNGANCLAPDDDPNSQKSLFAQQRNKNRHVTIVKECNSTVSPPPPANHADAHHQDDEAHHDHNGHHDEAATASFGRSNVLASELMDADRLRCTQVVCDFSDGPCAYTNDRNSSWLLRTIGSGNSIAFATGQSDASTHFLLSSTFILNTPATLQFHYFESSATSTHLRVCSNELGNTLWVADVLQQGWRNAKLTLAPGVHKIIFAAEKLTPTDLIAIDNIRLADEQNNTDICM